MNMSPLTFGVCVTLLPWLHAQPLRVRQQVQPVCSWAPGTESCLGQIPVPQELPHRVRPLLGDHLLGQGRLASGTDRNQAEPIRLSVQASEIWQGHLYGALECPCADFPGAFITPALLRSLCRTVGYIPAPFQWVVKHDRPQPFAGFTSDRMCCY